MKYPRVTDYPEYLHIGGEVYRIKFVTGPSWLGKCSQKKKTIFLSTEQPRKGMFSTFLHEFLHAAAFEAGIRIKHKSVYALEKALFSLFNDNLSAEFKDET